MGVKGNLKDISLTNLIQINCQSKVTGRLKLNNGIQQAHIYFSEGNIVHADLGNRLGEEAFNEILGWDVGQFELESGLSSKDHTITMHWSNLLLSGLHQLDESIAQEEEETTNELPIPPEDIGELFGFEKSSTTVKETDMVQSMQEILTDLGQEVPGFMVAAIVGVDGLGVVNHAVGSIPVETINARMTLLFKLVNTSVSKMEAGDIEDFLLTTDKTYLLLRYLSDKNYFLSIVADRRKANLGNLRLYSRVFAGRLSKAMPR